MVKPSTAYPFTTRREIATRARSDPAFAAECASVLQARTEQRAAGSAPAGKPWGWMSSERVGAGRLVAKERADTLSVDEESQLAKLVSRYSRQLADHFRSRALAAEPGLFEAAEKFGVGSKGSTPSDISQGPPEPKEAPPRCHPEEDRQPDVLENDLEAGLERSDDEVAPRVMEYVERSPGQRTEEVARALDVTTAMLAPALRMLVQARKLRKQGIGRGTRYFAR